MTDKTDLVHRAKAFAARAHRGQLRKYTNRPYTDHLEAVATIVAAVDHTPEMLAAALLHDVLEDTAVTVETLRAEFGETVASLVSQLTDISRPSDGNRAARKAIDRAHLARATPDAQTIKLADLLDNTASIVEHDPAFARVYLEEKDALLAVLTAGSVELHARARAAITAGRARLSHTETA